MSRTVCPECGHSGPTDEFLDEDKDPYAFMCQCPECGHTDLGEEFSSGGED